MVAFCNLEYRNSGILSFNFQIGRTKGEDNGYVINSDCIDVEHPADGNCNNGWKYWSGSWKLDNTIRLNCIYFSGGFFIPNV